MELDQNTILIGMFILMFAGILVGVHIGFAFGITALIGNILIFGGADGDWEGGVDIALRGVGSVAYEYLRSEVFAAIPLFMLLGDFVNRSGAAKDLYNLINHGLKAIPGRLAVATVAGNAVFAAVTGVSIAAAAAFSRIAYPQMRLHGYNRTFALGSVAGSACLGMIIPPSVLLIVWGIITEKSIAELFIAGAIPGLILAIFYMIYISVAATLKPELAPKPVEGTLDEDLTVAEIASGFGIGGLILLVLGGIWGGLFTPSEAAGVGAAGAMGLGILKGMRHRQIAETLINTGRTAAPVMFLLLTANMYAKFMEVAGMSELIRETFHTYQLGEIGIMLVIIVIWLILGMILDSISIILITVPIFAPLTAPFFDPIAFGIFGILVIEAGLLTPPFGLLVYTVKGSVDDQSVQLSEIFKGSVPYWILMLFVMLIIWSTPEVATWLPSKMM
ncbi:MAG: TRAP transporter large permease subunit [Rhodospirillales bacterium]|jgi:tripartite ATP-independent transporter DctM subunit|nr:C4-dicarboxylate ABC transporter permease [Rhodospirillaceae bacterium]MDP6427205.1 TRAP transporter large permease subunit [Rhodospirillales bacterium]MDP6645401.1 TRAP transporter large permease subunit [Rhodospirillales bacterium]MDP6841331.1 TRAP transporter large permease subunit [Rhodospirillales bacterium]|tara:strand:+ start:2112 stop:3452 length:1341 start_codon:yes stop_codon:yes gene_type:complete